jgi:hypothetical protein
MRMFRSPKSALRCGALAAVAAFAGCATPAFAKTKGMPDLSGAALDRACINAFGGQENFAWAPRMGLLYAQMICESAAEQSPDNADVQFYNAVARDQWAERGGTQDDNLYATKVYRRLAAQGHDLGSYALATMFDEDTGVTAEDARAMLDRAAEGTYGAGVQCDAMRIRDYSGMVAFDMAAAEAAAVGNPVCAGVAADVFWRGNVGDYDLARPLDSYVRYAAAHGDFSAMAVLGVFYAGGTGSTTITDILRDQYTAEQDPERAGYWLIIAFWGMQSVMPQADYDSYWYGQMFNDPVTAGALQTGLKALGYYAGPTDGVWNDDSLVALGSFVISGKVDPLFQRVRALEPMDATLGELMPIHVDLPAVSEAAGR